MTSKIISSGDPFDTNGDGVPDTSVGTFIVFDQAGAAEATVDRTWNLETNKQDDEIVAVVRLTLVITNLGSAWDFILQRHQDFDLVWVGDFTDDSVGTGTNRSKADRFVYQGEAGFPETHITLSSPEGDVYYGGKQGVLPDPDDPDCPP